MITVLHDHDGYDNNNLDKDDALTYYKILRHSVGIKSFHDNHHYQIMTTMMSTMIKSIICI